MKIKLFIFLGILLTNEILLAQTDFRKGYIIKPGSDSIYGLIDYRGDQLMNKICRFRLSESDPDTNYSANDIVGYRFHDGKYFVSKKVNGENSFLEYLIEGKVSIYYCRYESKDHYYIEKAGIGFAELPYAEEIRYKDSEAYLYKSKTHIGILNVYMQDAPELQTEIANIKIPNRENLMTLVENYQNIVCKNEICLIYKKKLPLFEPIFELTAGAGFVEGTNYIQTGLLVNLWMPRTNEKLYLRTGISTIFITIDNQNMVFLRTPVQFEYIYPKGIFRPKFSVGTNVYFRTSDYFSMTRCLAAMAGMNFRLNESILIGINYDLDLYRSDMYFIPDKVFSQSFLLGLTIKLPADN